MDKLANFIQENAYVRKEDKHEIYLVKIDKLLNVKNWSKNRPPNEKRIEEIKKSIENKELVNGIIYLAYLNDEWICYDGIHRLTSYIELNMRKTKVLVDVMYEEIEEMDVIKCFMNINKTVPVPQLFKEDINSEIKIKIIDCVKRFNDRYKEFFSNSNKPRIPNTNRDVFQDFIYDIYLSYPDKIENIEKNLHKLNEKLKDKTENEKCIKYGFYLFSNGIPKLSDYKDILK
jgi:hypothetical protein